MKVEHCAGCEDNFYNDHNPYGVTKCWMRDDAVLVERVEVGIWDEPPYDQEPKKVPRCYKKKGRAFLLLTDCRRTVNWTEESG